MRTNRSARPYHKDRKKSKSQLILTSLLPGIASLAYSLGFSYKVLSNSLDFLCYCLCSYITILLVITGMYNIFFFIFCICFHCLSHNIFRLIFFLRSIFFQILPFSIPHHIYYLESRVLLPLFSWLSLSGFQDF